MYLSRNLTHIKSTLTISIRILTIISLALFSMALSWSQDVSPRQSTTGPTPPLNIELKGHVFSGIRIQAATTISGVPAYLWRHGCGPTAVGMVIGYYDLHGYFNLIPGDSSSQGTNVNTAIASQENYDDYCLPLDSYPILEPDKSEPPFGDEHPNNSVADFMRTSQSYASNYYGWSWNSDINPSFENYVDWASDYQVTSAIYAYAAFTWESLMHEIDNRRPMVFLVDTDGDGGTDHFVTVVGYNSEGGINYYGCFNTWDQQIHWFEYRAMSPGNAWGVYSISTFNMGTLEADELNNVPPIKDTYINEHNGDSSYGSSQSLLLTTLPDNTHTAILLQYDISSIPTSAVVTNVAIVFSKIATDYETSSIALSLEAPNQEWVENCTWNSINSAGVTLLGGLSLNPTLSYPSIRSTDYPILNDLVQDWIQDPSSNRGLLLLQSLNEEEYISFYSKENTSGMNPPLLSISYMVPVNPPGPFDLLTPTNESSFPSDTVSVELIWQASSNAASYDIYFGTTSPPPYYGNTITTSAYVPVNPGLTYYWNISAKNGSGSISASTGPWVFDVAPVVVLTPDIQIEYSEYNHVLPDGYGWYFSIWLEGMNFDCLFQVVNTGTADLVISSLSISGDHGDQFSVPVQPATVIPPGGKSPFVIRFNPSSPGFKSGLLQIFSNVSGSKNPYDIILEGDAVDRLSFPFNEGSGEGIISEEWSAIEGHLFGDVQWVESEIKDVADEPGLYPWAEQHALRFDGVDDYGRLNPQPILTGPFTIMFWAKKSGPGSGSWISLVRASAPGSQNGYTIYWYNDNVIHGLVCTSEAVNWLVYENAPENTWVHIALTFGEGKSNLFINGALVHSLDQPGTLNAPNWDFSIGGQGGGVDDAYFNGLIDALKIYHRALTLADIREIYQKENPLSPSCEDLVGTWDGQGVYYRNSDTGGWVKMASPADMITTGDLDGDGIDDLIGLWPGQGGIWVKYSTTGAWLRLSSTARYIATGDMNGDGRVDLLGTWDGQGVYYRDSMTGAWVKMASEATMITSGDMEGDGIDDLLGLWPAQGGIWVKYSSTGAWARLSSTAVHIGAGDMNGDGRDDLLGTWDGQGVYYRDSMTGAWVKMASPATLITAGDIDGDGTDDLIGIWPTQGGVWVKYSSDSTWERLSSTARDIAAGKMRPASPPAPMGAMGEEASAQTVFELPFPMGGFEEGPESALHKTDLFMDGPGGWRFVYLEERSLEPGEAPEAALRRVPGPGEPGFVWIEHNDLFPQERLREGNKADRNPRSSKKEIK